MKLLAAIVLIAILVGLTFLGTVEIKVENGGELSVDEVLVDARKSKVAPLTAAQSDVSKVSQIFEELHSETMFRLDTLSTTALSPHYTSSLLMSFAIISTLGDDRVDDSKLVFYLVYGTLGSILFGLIITLLAHAFSSFFSGIFSSSRTSKKSKQNNDGPGRDMREEYFLAHLKKRRERRRGADTEVAFGGNKLELCGSETSVVERDVQPAAAWLLVFLIYVIVAALLSQLILNLNKTITQGIFAEFFAIAAITAQPWMNLSNLNGWKTAFVFVELVAGFVLLNATNSRIGSAFFEYAHELCGGTSRDVHLEREFDQSIWQTERVQQDFENFKRRQREQDAQRKACAPIEQIRKKHRLLGKAA